MGFSFLPHTFTTKRYAVKRLPTYLHRIKTSKNFYFRIRKAIFSKIIDYNLADDSHFVASLKTSEYNEALWLALFISKRLKDDMEVQKMDITSARLLNSQLKHQEEINNLFRFDEEDFKLRFEAFLKERFTYWWNKGKKMLQMGVVEERFLQNLRTVKPEVLSTHYAQGRNAAEIHPSVDSVLLDAYCDEAERKGFSINPRLREAEMINRLIAELSKLGKRYSAFDPELVSDTPEFDPSSDYEFLNLTSSLKEFRNFTRKAERKNKVESNKHLTLKTCVAEFTKWKSAGVGQSAVSQYLKSLTFFLEIFGDEMLITEFDGKHVVTYTNSVLSLPSGRKVDGVEVPLGKKSVNKYLSNVRQLFEWAVKQPKYIHQNPFSGVALKLEKKHQNKRRMFSADEIAVLTSYQPSGKKEARTIRNAAKWFVPIALYSGMRLNEISTLMVSDIKQAEGIHYFDLTLSDVKTVSSARIVPIHSKLIEMGFLAYVTKVKESGSARLFPELNLNSQTAQRDGPGTQVGNWFNDTMLAKIGINKKAELDRGIMVDFHCARHTVASRFKYHGSEGYVVKQILGHHQEDEITWGVYSGSERTKLSVLKATIEELDY